MAVGQYISNKEAIQDVENIQMLEKKADETKSPNDIKELIKQKDYFVSKYKYLVDMNSKFYKKFDNYEDLYQEGIVALLSSIKTFNKHSNKFKNKNVNETLIAETAEIINNETKKSKPRSNENSYFKWAHDYIRTRLSRKANTHTAVRYPLKFTKKYTPTKESFMPDLVDKQGSPEKLLENAELSSILYEAMDKLSPIQKNVISLMYGFTGDKKLTHMEVCNEINLPKNEVFSIYRSSIKILKNNIAV